MNSVFDLVETPIEEGVTLVEASAGTGKTYCITGLVLRLLLEGRAKSIGRILAVTFTNAATDELITRIRERLSEALRVFMGEATEDPFLLALKDQHGAGGALVLREALRNFDDVSICTIHGFCKRILERGAFESGMPFNAEFIQDDTPLVDQAAGDFWRRHFFEDRLLAAVAVAKGWEPSGFRKHYREWTRYPDTELLPDDVELPKAIKRLHQRDRELKELWDRPKIEALLKRKAWRKDQKLSENERDHTLDQVDLFCIHGAAADLTALECLTNAGIDEQLHHGKKEGKTPPRHPFFDACDTWQLALEALEQALIQAFVREVHKTFEAEKGLRHILTFDDLLARLHHALQQKPGGAELSRAMREQFDVALIDEFQDTNAIQYRIFKHAFEGRPLFFIGDPKQAIYGFRGADVFAYLAARKAAAREHTLNKNWRSHSDLVRAVNAVFERAPDPFVLDDILFAPVESAGKADEKPLCGDDGKPLQWWFVPAPGGKGKNKDAQTKEKARQLIWDAVVTEIVGLLSTRMKVNGKSLDPGKIAVLVRSNEEARQIQERLRRSNVPSIISKTGDILATREMEELEQVLRAVAEPRRLSAVRVALGTEMLGNSADYIQRLNTDDELLQFVVDELNEFRDEWLRAGFVPMIEKLITRRSVRRRLLAFEDGDRRLTNLLHAIEFLHQADQEHPHSPEGLLHWIGRARVRGSDDPDRTELRLETDVDAVQISTIHKSKGLEYEIVFCPTLWDGKPIKPDEPVLAHVDANRVVYDLGSPEKAEHVRLAEAERLAQDLRLIYVALTRAKQRCYVAWGAIASSGYGGSTDSALGYLLHADDRSSVVGEAERAVTRMKAVAGGIKKWQPELEKLVAENREVMNLRVLEEGAEPPVWKRGREKQVTLKNREAFLDTDERLDTWQIASFSSLARGGRHDAPDHADPEGPETPDDEAPQGIFAFARGERAGSCLHTIFEKGEFTDARCAGNVKLIKETLERDGLDKKEQHKSDIEPAEVVTSMLEQVLSTPMPGAGFALDEIVARQRLNEWRFYLPLGRLNPRAMSQVFCRHAGGDVGKQYGPQLGALRREEIHGYLTGFVDLVIERKGKWYVLDWKSNHLGNRSDAYGRDAIWRAMCDHNYILQYHLYVVALHRFLRSRISTYDYEKHIGGAWYVFLRGVDGGEDHGWYHDRPKRKLIEALDKLLSGSG